MKKKRFFVSTILILCTYLLLIFVSEYQRQQDTLFFESNDLYSTGHLFVKETFQTLIKETFKTSSDLSVFISLESKNSDNVRGYFSKDYSDTHFPLSNGSFFQHPILKKLWLEKRLLRFQKMTALIMSTTTKNIKLSVI